MREFSLIAISYCFIAVIFLALLQTLRKTLVRVGLSEEIAPSASLIASAVLAYPALFIYLVNPLAGFVYSVLIIAFALAGLRLAVFQQTPYVFALACGFAYLGAFKLYSVDIELRELPQKLFFEMPRPDDHQIQLYYLERILNHLPNRFGTFGNGWYFTDRPPLETSYTLLFYHVGKLFGVGIMYQAIGTLLQTTALATVWYLCGALRLRGRETRLTILIIVGSGFVYYNSVYLWPKMLAASLFIAAIVPIANAFLDRRRLTLPEVLVTASGCVMALLSHGTVAYSILALALLSAAFVTQLFTAKSAIAGVGLAIVLFTPWQAYTKFIDPNNGKLLKMHLTSFGSDSPEPFLTLLVKTYTTTRWSEWVRNRTANIAILGGAYYVDPVIAQIKNGIIDARKQPPLKSFDHENVIEPKLLAYDLMSLATVLRIDQREHFLRALGLMTLGLSVLLFAVIPQWRRQVFDRSLMSLLVLEGTTLVVWDIVEFKAYNCVLTHASSATVVLAFVATAVLLHRVSPRLAWAVGLTNIALNVILWVGFVPGPMIAKAAFDWKAGLAFAVGVTGVIFLSKAAVESENLR
jgi:hypothetical protein